MLRSFFIVCPLILILAGCGSRDSSMKTYSVKGMVTLDGKPIPTASVLLKDPSGQLRTCVATVQEGVLKGESTAGEKSVEITAFRIAKGKTVPGADGTGTEPAMEQYLPEKYNSESTLTVTISPGGTTPLNFELTSGQ